MNIVAASFNVTTVQMTEMSQRKKTQARIALLCSRKPWLVLQEAFVRVIAEIFTL